ncbi:MAG TPA: cyclic nucleotide-binding domain-containing protein, partial [Burkholderiaceae bacterium]
ALQKDPRQRFPTWQNFADQLSVIDSALTPEQEEYSDREKFLALRKNPFFESFNDPQIWQTLRAARWHRLRVGKVLMEEGKPGNSFSILIYGEVNVSKHGNHISRLKAGASLGEMAFLKPDQPLRTATITAATQVVAVKFTRAALEFAGTDLRAKFEQRFLEILVDRLSITSEKLAEVQT